MANEQLGQQPDPKQQPSAGSTDEVVQRHLQDKDHTISDEDIKNIKIGDTKHPTYLGAETEARFDKDKAAISGDTSEGSERISPEPGKPTPPNPWDVLGS